MTLPPDSLLIRGAQVLMMDDARRHWPGAAHQDVGLTRCLA